MSHRITLMITDENFAKLRKVQAKQIGESVESISFSKVANEALEKGLT